MPYLNKVRVRQYVEDWGRDVCVRRTLEGLRSRVVRRRGPIRCLSRRSCNRLIRYARNGKWRVMITLTYRVDPGPEKAKSDLHRFCQELRRRGLSGLWFMEFQLRGVVHYHILCTGYVPKEWVSSTWGRIVGDKEVERVGTRVEWLRTQGAGYVAKYAVKSEQKEAPGEGWGRFWGVFGRAVEWITVPVGAFVVRLLRRWARSRRVIIRDNGVRGYWINDGGKVWQNILVAYGCQVL